MKVRIVLLFQSKTTNKRASPRRRQSSPHTLPYMGRCLVMLLSVCAVMDVLSFEGDSFARNERAWMRETHN